MTEPAIRHNILVSQEAESDFHKIYEDVSEEEFFSPTRPNINQDEHKLVV